MTKERILLMIEKLLDVADYECNSRVLGIISKILTLYKESEDDNLPENNLVEFVWEDENGNGIYKIK